MSSLALLPVLPAESLISPILIPEVKKHFVELIGHDSKTNLPKNLFKVKIVCFHFLNRPESLKALSLNLRSSLLFFVYYLSSCSKLPVF